MAHKHKQPVMGCAQCKRETDTVNRTIRQLHEAATRGKP